MFRNTRQHFSIASGTAGKSPIVSHQNKNDGMQQEVEYNKDTCLQYKSEYIPAEY